MTASTFTSLMQRISYELTETLCSGQALYTQHPAASTVTSPPLRDSPLAYFLLDEAATRGSQKHGLTSIHLSLLLTLSVLCPRYFLSVSEQRTI